MNGYAYIADVKAWDGAAEVTLRFATHGFTTTPSDSPANTQYLAYLKQPTILVRSAFDERTTSGRGHVSVGNVTLTNDGTLDVYRSYGFDSRTLTIKRAPVERFDDLSAYTTVCGATMERGIFAETTVTLTVRDTQLFANVPIQTTTFAGTNVLPAGIEGTSDDLKGQVKPLTLGTVFNITPKCVNTSKLIYQVHDGAIASLNAVRDSGIPITAGTSMWTSRTSGFGASAIRGIAYFAGLWIAVGDSGKLFTSPDTVTWTSRTSTFGATNINAITSNGTTCVIVGDAGTMATSTDGITWTSRTSGFGATNMLCVCFVSSGTFVAGGAAGKVGVTGTITSGFTIVSSTMAGSLNTVFQWSNWVVAIGGTGGEGAYSPNGGSTWFTSTTFNQSLDVKAAASDGSNMVAVGGTGLVLVANSPLSTATQTMTTPFGSNNILAIAYGAGKFVAVDDAGHICTSTDAGNSWTLSASTGVALRAADYDGSILFAVGGSSGGFRVSAGPTIYANTTDLQDDTLAPSPGTYGYYLAGGLFRLGSSPRGAVTCDVSQGANAAARTAGQLFALVAQRAGLTVGEWSAADVTALDVANSAELGIYIDSTMPCADVLDLIASTVGAWWSSDAMGVFRIQQLTAPSGTPVVSLVQDQMLDPLTQLESNDDAGGLPRASTVIRYGRNYTPQPTGLDAGVSAVDKLRFAAEWRDATTTPDTGVLAAHPLAPTVTRESLFTLVADATAEATRQQALFGVQRDWFAVAVELDDTNQTIDLGTVVELKHPRFGMSVGKSFRALSVNPDLQRNRVALSVWGAQP